MNRVRAEKSARVCAQRRRSNRTTRHARGATSQHRQTVTARTIASVTANTARTTANTTMNSQRTPRIVPPKGHSHCWRKSREKRLFERDFNPNRCFVTSSRIRSSIGAGEVRRLSLGDRSRRSKRSRKCLSSRTPTMFRGLSDVPHLGTLRKLADDQRLPPANQRPPHNRSAHKGFEVQRELCRSVRTIEHRL